MTRKGSDVITSCCLVFIILDGHVGSPAGSSLPSWATILSEPSESGRCSFKASSGGAVIQVSTSSGVVENHRHRLGVDSADLGVRLRREERVEVVGGLAFLDLPDGGPVGPDAGEASEGAGLIEREPYVAAFDLVEFAKGVKAAPRRGSRRPCERVQCLLLTLRMLVVPPSGSGSVRAKDIPKRSARAGANPPAGSGVFMDAIEMWFIPKASPLQIDGPIRISEIAQGLDETLPVIARARWRRYARERRDRIAASAMRSSTRWALGGGGANAGQQM